MTEAGRPARRIEAEAGPHALEKLFALSHVQISPALRDRDDGELAALCLAEELAKLEATRGARREVEEAARNRRAGRRRADLALARRPRRATAAHARQGEDKTDSSAPTTAC